MSKYVEIRFADSTLKLDDDGNNDRHFTLTDTTHTDGRSKQTYYEVVDLNDLKILRDKLTEYLEKQ